jgi:hypothetical protein
LKKEAHRKNASRDTSSFVVLVTDRPVPGPREAVAFAFKIPSGQPTPSQAPRSQCSLNTRRGILNSIDGYGL